MLRSGKQGMIALSTAESELMSMLDGAVAMKGVDVILTDIGEQTSEKVIASDSTSALSISGGSCPWRTRHLRVKAGWLHEQLSSGQMTAEHCPGAVQPADLAARIELLLRLWGVEPEKSSSSMSSSAPMASSKMLVALICCLLMVSVQAAEEEERRPRGSGMQVDWDMAGIMMILLMLLGALMVWEAVRWTCLEVYYEWSPGSSTRKLKRLKKLQQATTAATDQELRKLQRRGDPRPDPPQGQASSTMSGTSDHLQEPRQEEIQHLQGSSQVSGRRDGLERDFTESGRSLTPVRRSPTPTRRVTPMRQSSPLRGRVCDDTCKLMTCECLREA